MNAVQKIRSMPKVADDAAVARDPEAFRVIYRCHVDRVRSVLVRLAGPGPLDDLTQEVFLRVWDKVAELREPAYLGTWIYRVAINVATDHLRRRTSLGKWQTSDDDAVAAAAGAGPAADRELHARRVVAEALTALDAEHRTVLVLFDIEGMPQGEIAAALGLPVGTVKSRLFHARKQVRELLAREGIEP